jgi:hypothetical protein
MSGVGFSQQQARQPEEPPREVKMTTRANVDCEFCCGYALFLFFSATYYYQISVVGFTSLRCSTMYTHPRSGRLPGCKVFRLKRTSG